MVLDSSARAVAKYVSPEGLTYRGMVKGGPFLARATSRAGLPWELTDRGGCILSQAARCGQFAHHVREDAVELGWTLEHRVMARIRENDRVESR